MKRLLRNVFATIVALTAGVLCTSAQMTFTLNDVTGTTSVNPLDGSTTITVPAGTNLNGLITGVKIDGTDVIASQITPNPTTTLLEYGELEVFTYNNKAYGFRFVEDVWFCAVFISDCHTNQTVNRAGSSVAELQAISNNIINMGKDGTAKVTFTGVEGLPSVFIPKTSIVFCTGDIDGDKGDDGSKGEHTNFLSGTAEVFKDAGIPFIFIAGNHDFSPDYWTDGSNGVTYGSTGGSNADDKTISAIKTNNSYWSSYFDSDGALEYITGGSGSWQPNHFTFKFKDVRFYCANNYWFQKPYNKPGLLSSATYYAPDGIITKLNSIVDAHKDEASVWMQHYSFLFGSDINRWWLDQNESGQYKTSSNTSIYGCSTSGIDYNDANSANTLKKDPLVAIMEKTKNHVHFSGHQHNFGVNTYTSSVNSDNHITDYTTGSTNNSRSGETNNAYVVLLKRGEGVKAVVQAKF